MADRYLLESSAVDGYLLEDGSGVLLLEGAAGPFKYLGTRTSTQLYLGTRTEAQLNLGLEDLWP